MDPLEDAPQDVQDASPVADELRQAELDRVSTKTETPSCKQLAESRRDEAKSGRQCCNAQKPKQEKPSGCCDAKRQKREASEKKTMKLLMHGKPCPPAKIERIPRHCMTKEEYINFLATPNNRCVESCAMQPVVRRLRVVSPRIDELAKPTRRRVAVTLAERAMVMPAEMLDRMVELLEAETALTPEQAEHLVREKQIAKRRRKKKQQKQQRPQRSGPKCPEAKSCPTRLLEAGEPSIDAEAARCQYLMAVRFVRSILSRQCEWQREDYEEVSDVILERLARQLEYVPLGCEDRRSQQMRILADVLACWVTDVLVQLAERHKLELLDDCRAKRDELAQVASLLETRSQLEDQHDQLCSDPDSDADDLDEQLLASCRSVAAAIPPCETAEEQQPGRQLADAACQYEPPDDDGADSEAGSDDAGSAAGSEPSRASDDGRGSDAAESRDLAYLPLAEEAAAQTELARSDAATEPDRCCDELALAREQLEQVAARVSASFCADVPFLTFGKIVEALFCMLECLEENALEDRIDNRVHRAVFARLERAMRGEPLDPRTRDVLDVVAGKLALWMRRTLDQEQIRYMDEHPDAVESREVRDWARWALGLADWAEEWSCWINKVTGEAHGLKHRGRLSRGAWAAWTGKVETNAMLWRRMYLESVHTQHFNTMMMAGRPVCKAPGAAANTKAMPSEATIRNTNFDSTAKIR